MAKPLLHAGKDVFVVISLDVDDPVGLQTDLSKGRREEICLRNAPQHFALGTGGDAGAEQCGCRAIDRSVSASGDFVQGTHCQTAAG